MELEIHCAAGAPFSFTFNGQPIPYEAATRILAAQQAFADSVEAARGSMLRETEAALEADGGGGAAAMMVKVTKPPARKPPTSGVGGSVMQIDFHCIE